MTKNILWTFGDSYTFGYGCRPDCYLSDYYYKYKKEGDYIWTELLAKKLNLKLVNLAERSISNDRNLDLIIENYNYINKGDYVILGKTLYQRFDVANYNKDQLWHVGPICLHKNGNFDKIYPSFEKMYEICGTKKDYETLINFIYNFSDNKLYEKRQKLRFDFLKRLLIDNKKIDFYYEWSVLDCFIESKIFNFERIYQHTNNEIEDGHFSFKGHYQMYEYLLDKINNKKLI